MFSTTYHFYWVHPFLRCYKRSVALYSRTLPTLQWRFSKCWIVESSPVGAWVLLKPYILLSPILAIHCSLWTNHSLSPHKTYNYHHHPCSTQQLFYEVEIICFSLIFMTQQTVMMLVSLAGQIVYSTAVSDVNDKLMDFCCFLLFSAISSQLLKKMCQFCATGVKSSAFCIDFGRFSSFSREI